MSSYLLVPGAGGDSGYWYLVAPLLRDLGHELLAPDLPFDDDEAGLAEHADAVVDAADEREGVVLVAQSMGAYPATMVCDRLDVRALVLLVPMIPAPGESPGEWWSATGQDIAWRESELRAGRDPDAPFDVTTMFLHDVPPEVAETLLARGEPGQADKPFEDPWPLDAWPAVPTHVIAGRHDRLLPLEFMQRLSSERLGIDPEVIDSGHLPALSRPLDLVQRLEAYRQGRSRGHQPGTARR